MADTNKDFESSLKKLELIVEKLNDGSTSLEESIELFEQGIGLSKECSQKLEKARQKIIMLSDAENEENNND